jgi:pimeloyl-ACP methyl ester carboxylesterase
MATFVLVHGSWHGSWCWKRVRTALQKLGHEVFTPTLTGLGERSHLLVETVDLRTHTLDVLNLVRWEELNDFVLCGHSSAGMVVSGVADTIPERLRSLVFLDAFVPDPGQRLMDFIPTLEDQLIDGWKAPPMPAQALGVNAVDQPWVDRQCTPHPAGCFRQPVQLTGDLGKVRSIAYIYASGWAGDQSPFYAFYQKARSRGWKTSEIECGHDAMLDQPDALATLLLSYV